MLCAQCRPQGEELVIRIGKSSTAADGDKAWVALFGQDHTEHSFCLHLPSR
ncbi:MAG: hypothetical protein R3C14_08715 [Caldilineaceae bacterium]